jgi:hypothetical protein
MGLLLRGTSGVGVLFFFKRGPSFMQVVEGIFQRGENDDIRLFVGVARRVWLRRNEFIHDGFFANPDRVMQGACPVMEEFQLIAAQSIYH